MIILESVSYIDVDITGGFWAQKQKLNREVTVFEVMKRYTEVGRFDAFRFSRKEGDTRKPHYFWDSDVAKWMEAVSYIIKKNPNDELKSKLDELIDLIEKNQQEDGYFNIYHTVVEPHNKFKIRDHHELYCFGHLLEAAVAYFESTGSDRFLKITDKYTDLIIKVFTEEKSAGFVTPGHEEIELALFKAYKLTGNKKYFELAMFFLNERGKDIERENDPLLSWANSNYNQSHLPVREQLEAFGHSVRACYLYCGMADGAKYAGDEKLFNACRCLFDDITQKKMSITGGIGSTNKGEAFTVSYDLPNDTAYNETCAAISLSLFAERMKNSELNGKYADITEKEMYNGILAGISLDGTSFFYENPLEINLSDRTRHTSHLEGDRLPITQRKKDFDCSCCPPNVTRYIASIGSTVLSKDETGIYIHQFMTFDAVCDGTKISMKTLYPVNGKISLNIENPGKKELYIRVPSWCDEYYFSCEYTLVNGYARIKAGNVGGNIDFEFIMKPRFLVSNKKVRANAGKCALMYGPVVYCAEKTDNDFDLFDFQTDTSVTPVVTYDEEFLLNRITAFGTVADSTKETEKLYFDIGKLKRKEAEIKLIPYSCYENRGETDMAVWLGYK